MAQAPVVDGRLARGDESRRRVLRHALDLASTEGLDGLSFGRLADASRQSKSGIATLFGSKEGLQLAAVAAAREVFAASVVEPVRATTPAGGLARVIGLTGAWLSYSRRRVFSGGCFFAATVAEFDARPGAVQDALRGALDEWEGYLSHSIRRAMASGELPGLDEAEQLAFEIAGILEAANNRSLLRGEDAPYERAARTLRERFAALGASPDAVSALVTR